MRQFFHGWRRKAGCVAMVVAVCLTCAWMRSHFIVEKFSYFSEDGPRHAMTLLPDGIQWTSYEGTGQYVGPMFLAFGWESTEFTREEFADPMYGWHTDWNWECCGFQFGHFKMGTSSVLMLENAYEVTFVSAESGIWRIPFWSVILPVTFLSGYLILWKPRKRAAI